jgi:hypothetical protein
MGVFKKLQHHFGLNVYDLEEVFHLPCAFGFFFLEFNQQVPVLLCGPGPMPGSWARIFD